MSQRVPFQGFVGSAFGGQAKRLDTQNLMNWYLERASSPAAKSPQALLPCPGFSTYTTLPTHPVRGLFAQNDRAFAVAGTKFYELTTTGGYVERPLTTVESPLAPVVTVSPLALPIFPPGQPVLMHGGATGSTTYGYTITAINNLGETTGSPQALSGFGNATLSLTNWNIVSWPAVEHCTGYKVYRTTGGPPVLVRTVASTTLVVHDTGDADTGAVSGSPPTTNTTGGVAGTTTYSYQVSALLGLGETAASPAGSTAIGADPLTSVNYTIVTWTAVTNAKGYRVYRTAGGPLPPRLIAEVMSDTLSVRDTGEAGEPLAPPTLNTTGVPVIALTSNSKTNPSIVTTAAPHGLQSGWTVLIADVIGSDADINGLRVVTVLSATTFSVPVNVSASGGTGGTATLQTPSTIVDDGRPVLFASSGDAGEQLLFISGDVAYCYDFEGNVLAPVVQGASAVGFIDSYFVVLDASTSTLKVSESFDGCHWDPTQVYQRSRAGDKWLAMAVTSNVIWLIGSQTGEVWTGTGQAETRFTPYSPVFIETGIIAPGTMTRVSGDTMMWVAQDKDGAGYVVRTNGYAPEKVSTNAVDHSIQNLPVINDGDAFSYQQEGHTFYVLNFPAAQTTWVFDLSTGEWHRRGYWNPDVAIEFQVYRPQCHAFAFGGIGGLGLNLVGDRTCGVVARMHHTLGWDIDGAAIRRVRQCPIVSDRDQEMTFDRLQLDMDVGEGLSAGQGVNPTIMLTYSNDAGRTWGNELWRMAGKQGDYRIQVAWSRLGTGKERVFRLVATDPTPWRIVGAWLEAEGS